MGSHVTSCSDENSWSKRFFFFHIVKNAVPKCSWERFFVTITTYPNLELIFGDRLILLATEINTSQKLLGPVQFYSTNEYWWNRLNVMPSEWHGLLHGYASRCGMTQYQIIPNESSLGCVQMTSLPFCSGTFSLATLSHLNLSNLYAIG